MTGKVGIYPANRENRRGLKAMEHRGLCRVRPRTAIAKGIAPISLAVPLR